MNGPIVREQNKQEDKPLVINPLKCDHCGGSAVSIIKTGCKESQDKRADLYACLTCGKQTKAVFTFESWIKT